MKQLSKKNTERIIILFVCVFAVVSAVYSYNKGFEHAFVDSIWLLFLGVLAGILHFLYP